MPNNQNYVSLVAQGGTPVRLADQRGAPYPTTGYGELVFSNGPTLRNPIIDGGWIVLETGRAIAHTITGQVWVSDPLTSDLIRIRDARSDGNGHVLIETYGEHGLVDGNTVNVRIDGKNGTTKNAHPGNGNSLPITRLSATTFSLNTTTWVADSEFWSGFLWSTDTEIVNARPELLDLMSRVSLAGGGTVQLPVGVCVLQKVIPATGPGLVLYEGVNLVGMGYEVSTLFAYDGLNGFTLQSAGAGNLALSGFTIYGNRQGQGVGGFHAIRFGADNVLTKNVRIDVWIQAAAGYGVGLQSRNSSFRGFRINVRVNGCDSDGLDLKNRASGNDDNEIIALVENFGLFNVGITPLPYTLSANPFTTVSGSQNVTVQHPSNNFSVGITVTYPNGGTLNGVNLTGSFQVVAKAGKDAYVIATGQTANASSSGGGSGVIEYNAQFSQGDAGIDLRGEGFLVQGRVLSDLQGLTGIRFRPGQTLGDNPGATFSTLTSGFVANTGNGTGNSNGVSVGRNGNNFNNLIIQGVNQGISFFATASGNNFSNVQINDCTVGIAYAGLRNSITNASISTCTKGMNVIGGQVQDTQYFSENPFTVTTGSPIVTADAPGHGQTTGALVTIADARAAFGIDFNAVDRPITVLDANTFTYDPQSGNATGNGAGGGENAYYSFGTIETGRFLQISGIRTAGCGVGIDISPDVTGLQLIGHASDGDSVGVNDQGGGSYVLPPLTLDPDVTDWAAAVISNGGAITSDELIPINAFVLSEKASGAYALTDEYFPLGWTANAIAGRTSFKQHVLATVVNAPVFTAYQGYTGDGVSSYVNSQFAPSVRCAAATGGNVRVSGYVLSGSTGTTSILGAGTGATIRLRPSSGTAVGAQVCASLSAFPDSVTSVVGYTAAQRAGTTTMSGQKDGVALTDVVVTSAVAALPSDVMTLLARNSGGAVSEYFAGELFMATIGAPLSLSQGQAQNDNIIALLAAIGP